MPTYHPAYLLKVPKAKATVWHDLQIVMTELGLKERDVTARIFTLLKACLICVHSPAAHQAQSQ